jgi:small-conductance mechanosensitive channel
MESPLDSTPALFQVVIAVAFVAGGLLLGLLMGRVLLGRLDRLTCRAGWGWCAALVRALRGLPQLWLALLGLYLGAAALPLAESAFEVVETFLTVLAILSATWLLGRLVVALVGLYTARPDRPFPAGSIFANLAGGLVAILGLLVVLEYLGISIAPMLTALGVGGLAVALALQDTLSNLFAGFHILASRELRPGDFVRLETGEEGYVEDITWRSTAIRELPGNLLVIPNARLAKANFRNYDLPEKPTRVLLALGVSYDSDLPRVEEVTLEVARHTVREVTGGDPEYEPLVRFHTFGDHSIDFNVIIQVAEFTDSFPVKHELVKRLHRRYAEEGIRIPFPIRTVLLEGTGTRE